MFLRRPGDESPDSNDLAPTLGGQGESGIVPVPRVVPFVPTPQPVTFETLPMLRPLASQSTVQTHRPVRMRPRSRDSESFSDYLRVMGAVVVLGFMTGICSSSLLTAPTHFRKSDVQPSSVTLPAVSRSGVNVQIDDAKRWMATHQKSMFFVVSRPNPPGYCEFVEIDQATEVAILAAAQHEGIPMIRGRFLPRLQNQYDALAEVIGQRADRRVLFCPARSATDSEWLCCQFVKGLPLASAVPIFASDGVRRVGRVYGDGVFSYGDN